MPSLAFNSRDVIALLELTEEGRADKSLGKDHTEGAEPRWGKPRHWENQENP